MKLPLVIPKESKFHESEDFEFLRQQGMKYVEDLASESWTDFNVHDPGITLMEALCFAITDLGHRTSFEVKDILAREGSTSKIAKPPIFQAREILTSNPWTLTDFRKILVDVDGIRNAWLKVADCQEVDFFANCKASKLEYFSSTHKIEKEKLGKDRKILTTYINDPANTESEQIRKTINLEVFDPIANIQIRYNVEFLLPGWLEIENRIDEFLDFINLDTIQSIQLQNVEYNNETGVWWGDILLDFDFAGQNKQITLREIRVEGVSESAVRNALETTLLLLNQDHVILAYQGYLYHELSRLTEHTVAIRGLYEVMLQYELDDQFGDLNNDILNYTLTINEANSISEIDLEAAMPSWRGIYQQLEDYYPFIQADNITQLTFENESLDPVFKIWKTDFVLQYDGQGSMPDIIWKNITFTGIETETERDHLKANLALMDARSLLGFFHDKLKKLLHITEAVEFTLHEHRSLCEDYKKISPIGVNEVAVCADIVLENDANLLEVQAEIWFQIQQYLSPSIRFYSLEEMEAMKIPTEEIFNGPALQHGFILDHELKKSDLSDKRFVYVSDMINLIMDVDGVKAVKDLLLTKYNGVGQAVLPSERWCLQIDPLHKAELSIGKSKLLFFKDGLPYILPEDKEAALHKKINQKRAIAERYKLKSEKLDYPLPVGTPLNFSEYRSVRHILPQTYGVGIEGLPESASKARKGKASQLKAFLLFFDQLLANYVSQLSNLDELFSLDSHHSDKDKKTYYTRFLSEDLIGAALYFDEPALKDLTGPDIGEASLQRIFESHSTYLDRRNRFLDHLLARFAESFSDYALRVFQILDDNERQILIQDKIEFLKEYPIISSQRGKGFNYKHVEEIWDTNNVAGLKKRMSKLLGMPDYTRNSLHCQTIRDNFRVVGTPIAAPTDFTFVLTMNGTDILTSPKQFNNYDDAFEAMEEAIAWALEKENYTTEPDGAQFKFQIGEIVRDPVTDTVITKDIFLESVASFATELLAIDEGESVQQEVAADFEEDPCTKEGFHLIEHLLLRPKYEFHDTLFEVCLNPDCFFCGEEDPYSFRVTAVLPYWMEKFVDPQMKIREYTNRLFRQEAPAHVHLKICWVNNSQMRLVDLHYRRWLEENAKRFPNKEMLSRRLNALISIMGKLRNVYAEGFLHDCEDSEEENTIILNKSYLGSFNPPSE